MFYPQASFYPQTNFAQLSHPNAMHPNNYSPYGVSQQTPFFGQQTPFFGQQQTPFLGQQQTPFLAQLPYSNWQQSLQQPARPPLGMQPPFGIQQPLGIQPPFGLQPPGINAFHGIANGAAQQDPTLQQFNQTLQLNPALQQASYGHLLQQLAQYHNAIAQQLAQLAAQTALVGAGSSYYPFAGQFIPGQLSPNFGSGITMH
jgi:hypothetical protein